MIQNERQYLVTKTKIQDLEQALLTLECDRELAADSHPRLIKMQKLALESQIQTMYAELSEYESLKNGTAKISISRLEELPIVLIKARIAAGMTQKELAERIGIKEQQIQRYEANQYQAVGFDRLLEIATSLGIKLMDEVVFQHDSNNLYSVI